MLTPDPYRINLTSARRYFQSIGYNLVNMSRNILDMSVTCTLVKPPNYTTRYTVVMPFNIISPDLPNYIAEFYPELLL